MPKSTRPMIKIHNISTGEIEEREMNDSELAIYEADEQARLTVKATVEAKVTAREAILDRLGITAEEAAILLG
jgi:hypothetical protein